MQLASTRRIRSPSPTPALTCSDEEQKSEFDLLGEFEQLSLGRVPRRPRPARADQVVRAGVPDADGRARGVALQPGERSDTQALRPRPGRRRDRSASMCLAARRLVERGVRFVQVFHGSNGGAGAWDAHGDLKKGHTDLCKQVDQPIAGSARRT